MQKKEVKKWQDEEALKRRRMIAPLLDEGLDEGKRRRMREEAAQKNGISKRSLYRYEAGYRDGGFEGLRPGSRTKKRMQRLPDNFDEVMEQAVQLKREVPKRSVRQIIKILELEGWAAPGVLKQSTMQRRLYEAGPGKKQMKRYFRKGMKNRPSGVSRAVCFSELCLEQAQFHGAGYLAAFEDIRQFCLKEQETQSG